jgi:hypothetical protein
MPKIIDLTGQTFGKLTVVSVASIRDRRGTSWNCDCACGNTFVMLGVRLRCGNAKSCGCIRKTVQRTRMLPLVTGRKFGRLTPEKYEGKNRWLCRCDCNRQSVVTTKRLLDGLSQSCGCLRKELLSAQFDKKALAHVGEVTGNLHCEAYLGKRTRHRRNEVRHFFRFRCLLCGTKVERPWKNKGNSCGCTWTLASIRRRRTPEQQVMYVISTRLRNLFKKAMESKNLEKANATFAAFGYTQHQVVEHIKSKLKPGMTWENRRQWHIDHIVAVSTAETEAELIKLFALENLQVLWWWENLSKGSLPMDVWQKRQGVHATLPAPSS